MNNQQAMSRRALFSVLGLGSVALVAACTNQESAGSAVTQTKDTPAAAPPKNGAGAPHLTVYKDPTCGCCGGWIDHAEAEGFSTTTKLTSDLNEVFARYDIPAELQSCHLASTASGMLIVGHVPIRFVREYLAKPPEGSRGLSVPAMPVGSPGMEQGDDFEPYEVFLLTNGEPTLFAKVTSAREQ